MASSQANAHHELTCISPTLYGMALAFAAPSLPVATPKSGRQVARMATD